MLGVSTLPSDIVHQGSYSYYSAHFWCLSPDFLGEAASHSSKPLWGLLGSIYSGSGVAIGPNVLWSTPSYLTIHLRGYIEGVPLNAEASGAWQTYDVASRVYFTLYFPRKQYTDRAQYADRHTGQPMHPRCQSVQYLPANQSSSTSMEVSSRWFWCHL